LRKYVIKYNRRRTAKFDVVVKRETSKHAVSIQIVEKRSTTISGVVTNTDDYRYHRTVELEEGHPLR
jgi:hypothetical protein